MKIFKKFRFLSLLMITLLVIMVAVTGISLAEQPSRVNLGTAQSFAVLAGSGITVAGAENTTTIYGDIGSYPTGSYTGAGNVVQTGGDVYLAGTEGEGVAMDAKADLLVAYNDAAGRDSTMDITDLDLGNLSSLENPLLPGVYTANTSLGLTGTLYLYADSPNDAFIFQIGTTLTTASASNIVLLGEATECQVYWQVGSSATLGTNSTFVGHILALTDITATTGAEIEGALLALNGAVTLDTNTITIGACTPPVEPDDDAPAISVKKYVSVDGGDTWHDAQSAPGPSIEAGSEVQFKFVVTNTGNVALTDITLSDDVYDLSGAVLTDPLPAGDFFEYILAVTAVEGQHQNTATITGDHGGETYSDTDVAHYWSYVSDAPAISVKKYISVDGGDTWHDAQSAPGPSVEAGSEVQFKFVVTNTGNVALTDITLSDDVYDLSGAVLTDPLPVGDFFEYILAVTAVEGQHQNTATTTGDHEEVTYSDTDIVHYSGFVPDVPATGSLTVTKVVSGDTAGITLPLFKITVTGPEGFTATRTFAGGESFTWHNLVPGTYTVTEDKTGLSEEWTVSGEGPVNVIADQTALTTITNTFLADDVPATGSLTVTKVVSGDTAGITLPLFKITVTGPEGFTATRTFAGGESFTWHNLVPGTYIVTEDKTGLSEEWTVSGEGPVNVIADQTALATITNTFLAEEVPVGSLKVTKVVSGDTAGITLPLFKITVTGPGGFTATRTFVHGESFIWENLVPGVYTVTENKEGLSSRWTVSGEGAVSVIADRTALTTIKNEYKKATPKTGGLVPLTTYSGLILFGIGLLMKGKRK